MANYYAQQDGNINSLNMWNTMANGTGAFNSSAYLQANVLYSNGHVIEINTNVNCTELRSTLPAGIYTTFFNVSNPGITITANITAVDATCVTSLITSGTLTINGTIRGSSTWGNGVDCTSATGNLVVTGSVYSGSFGSSGVGTGDTCPISITGNVYGGSDGGSAAVNTGSSNITLIGNAYGGSSFGTYGIMVNGDCEVYVTGNIYAGSSLMSAGINTNGRAITITNGILYNSLYAQAVSGPVKFNSEANSCYLQYPLTAGGTINFPPQLTADLIKKSIVSGTVTGTLEATVGGGGGAIIGLPNLVG